MSENKTSHLETVQDKRSISDGLVLKPRISYGFPVFFLYHYLTLYIHLTQSHLAVAIFSLMLNLS
jgi:hypothetical protein